MAYAPYRGLPGPIDATLHVRLPLSSYADILHRVLACVPDGEIGHLTHWRAYLRRQRIANGG